jgi:hypothetical protein
MGSILEAAIAFTGTSIVGGITWDVIKGNGLNLLKSFEQKFLNSSFFVDKKQCEDFFKTIATNESNSEKRPFNDIRTVFEESTDKDYSDDFQKMFIDWISENQDVIRDLNRNNYNHTATININAKQIATHNGVINIIGNQINN